MEHTLRDIVKDVARRLDAFDMTVHAGGSFPEPHMLLVEIDVRRPEDINRNAFGNLWLVESKRQYRGMAYIIALSFPALVNEALGNTIDLFKDRVCRRFDLAVARYQCVMLLLCRLLLPMDCIRELRDYLF